MLDSNAGLAGFYRQGIDPIAGRLSRHVYSSKWPNDLTNKSHFNAEPFTVNQENKEWLKESSATPPGTMFYYAQGACYATCFYV
jgi:hypothetical protein